MTFQVSKAARADLRSIGRYTQEKWGADQRCHYLNELNKKFYFLCDNPLISTLRSEFTPPVRSHHHEKHLIIYQVADSSITIVRVLHEHMDIDFKLDQEHR